MSLEENHLLDSEEEQICLPADTLRALAEFYKEQEDRERLEQQTIHGQGNAHFEENWQLSQFWYNNKTKEDIAKVCNKLLKNNSELIGLLSCPSLYVPIKNIHKNVKIFEYDKRFASYGDDFLFYDFNDGDQADIIKKYTHNFDIIIADPPFLSESCIKQISIIVKKLSKINGKVIFCSGEVTEPWLKEYLGLEKYEYRPQHERNLGNEFASYANFNLDEFF